MSIRANENHSSELLRAYSQEPESFMNIEDILNLHAVTDSSLRNDLQRCIDNALRHISCENTVLKHELHETKEQVKQMQETLDQLEASDYERSHAICSALDNITSMGTDYQLTKIQKEKIKEEMKTVDSMHNLGLKNIEETEDISTIINELFFDHVADTVEKQCPLLTQIIKLLCLGRQPGTNTGKKTDKFKFKSALHILNAIGEIRSQRTTNDFALMFGLLLISYGCGKSVLNAVYSIGLCKSYDF